MYTRENLAIIIPTIGYSQTFQKLIDSIEKQSITPGQIIVSSYYNLNLKKNKKINIKIFKSSKKNQVYQRTFALKYLKSKIKILIQLDDKVILEKNALKNLLIQWNLSNKNVAGIAFAYPKIKKELNFNRLLNNYFPGKILKNGLNIQYGGIKKIIKLDWMRGGMCSWKLDLVPEIFKRKFPLIKWCVCEDVMFSYGVSRKYELCLAPKAKAKVIGKLPNLNYNDNYLRGYCYSKIYKLFISKNKNLCQIGRKFTFKKPCICSINLTSHSIQINK